MNNLSMDLRIKSALLSSSTFAIIYLLIILLFNFRPSSAILAFYLIACSPALAFFTMLVYRRTGGVFFKNFLASVAWAVLFYSIFVGCFSFGLRFFSSYPDQDPLKSDVFVFYLFVSDLAAGFIVSLTVAVICIIGAPIGIGLAMLLHQIMNKKTKADRQPGNPAVFEPDLQKSGMKAFLAWVLVAVILFCLVIWFFGVFL